MLVRVKRKTVFLWTKHSASKSELQYSSSKASKCLTRKHWLNG